MNRHIMLESYLSLEGRPLPNYALKLKLLACVHFTGQLLLAKGEVEQAFNAFKIVLEGFRDNVPALLGQVCQ